MPEDSIGVRFWQALVLLAGIRAAYLTVAYLSGSTGTLRHHVESGTLAFVVLGAPLLFVGAKGIAEERRAGTRHGAEWVLWGFASLRLYWPSIGVGSFQMTSR